MDRNHLNISLFYFALCNSFHMKYSDALRYAILAAVMSNFVSADCSSGEEAPARVQWVDDGLVKFYLSLI